MAASSASEEPVGGPDGGARPFWASVSSPRNQSSGGWVQNSLVPDSYFFSGFCCAPAWVIPKPVIPAMARMAAHATTDRLKADFIASLPKRPGRAAAVICSTRDELVRLRFGSDRKMLPHPRKERSALRAALVGGRRLRRNFF